MTDMNSSYFEQKRYLKNAIKETYDQQNELDELLIRYHARNKKAHNSLDARRYREMFETAGKIKMANDLKQAVFEARKFYEKQIKKLID